MVYAKFDKAPRQLGMVPLNSLLSSEKSLNDTSPHIVQSRLHLKKPVHSSTCYPAAHVNVVRSQNWFSGFPVILLLLTQNDLSERIVHRR